MTDPSALPPLPPEYGPLSGGPVSPDDVLDLLQDALEAAGLPAHLDEDGDLAVLVLDQRVFVRCVDSVPPLARVFGQWMIGDDLPGGELVRLRAANALTGALNLLKVTVHDDRLVVCVDLVVAPGLPLASLLAAAVDAVVGSVHTWHETVLEMAGVED